MDNSSRNVVKFIATITAAALLFMAARFYADAQKEPQLPSPVQTTAAPLDETPAPEPATNAAASAEAPQMSLEEIPAITGEPSVVIPGSEPVKKESASSGSAEPSAGE